MSDFHPAHPHDHFFRRTFDVLENLRALLRTQLPAGLLARLDLNSIQPAKDTFVGSEEHEKRLDLLYSARLVDGTEVLVYLLLEHKSWVDRRIALQLFGYVLRILEWQGECGGRFAGVCSGHAGHLCGSGTAAICFSPGGS